MTAGRSTPAESAPDRAAAAAALPERIAFIGFGLMGGSIAGALRVAGTSSLAAWSPNGQGPAEGRRLGLLDVAADSFAAALDGAGLVVLAGPPLAVLAGLEDIAGAMRGPLAHGATITDVASTKGRIVERASELRLAFVGGHPMAGRETSGVTAARAELFEGRPWVIVPAELAGDADLARVEQLAIACGAKPIRMTADEHDRAVAAISHLPLVLAAALVEAVAGGTDWRAASALASTGWADMTRLARGDPDMGAGILATNGAAVGARLRDLRAVLDSWIADLDGEADATGLRARLAASRAALEAPARGESGG